MPKFFKNRKIITDNKVQKFIRDPRFVARMAKFNSIPVISKYDVPYLCGYSMDGKKIYFDRHLDPILNGKDITKFLKLHEYSEKALLDIFNMDYQQAHHIASHLEHQAVTAAGIKWSAYDAYLKPLIKRVSVEDLTTVPPDLDLEPYVDENDKKILKRLISKEKSTSRTIKESYLDETKISLEYHDELNPKLWEGPRLNYQVKKKLLDFAHAWASFAKIPADMITDVIMTGGNANYNYTAKSDIDVHIIINRNLLNPDREFVDEYLQDKKVLWTLTHKISILGYALEPYAQDSAAQYPRNQGVYSILNSRWVQFPNKGTYDWKNDPGLKRKVLFYKKLIDQIIKDKMDIDAVKDMKKKLRDMRNASIAKGGEFSFENLVFKELRNRGYLDKMNKYEASLKDQALSLK